MITTCSVKRAELPEAQSSSYGGRPPFEVNITEVNQLITGVANPSPPRLRVLSPFLSFPNILDCYVILQHSSKCLI